MISRDVREVLHGECLNPRYAFEDVDINSLFLEPMDSQNLIHLCDANGAPELASAPKV